MPLPVTPWTADTPISSKSLNLAAYTCDGTLNNPNGIALHAQRPMSFQVIGAAGVFLLFDAAPGDGTQTAIGNAGDTEAGVTVLDSAGYYGQSTDGVYWISSYSFTPSVIGTNGDGITAGGWTIMCHFIPVLGNVSTSIDAVGAGMYSGGSPAAMGSLQGLAASRDCCAFYLDLQNVTGAKWQPSVLMVDSTSTTGVPVYNATDSSGETPRFFTIWECISDFGISPGYGQPALPAPFPGPYTSATTVGTTGLDDVDVNSAAGIAGPVNFLSNPPIVRVGAPLTSSIFNNAATLLSPGSSPDADNYSGWNGTNTYTVQRDGLYLVHGVVAFSANANGSRRAGIQVNGGTTYWGPGYDAPSAGRCCPTTTRIFSLQAGDTISLMCEQNSGASLALVSAFQTRLFAAWLGLEGTPSTLWTPPDPSFRWVAGTPGTSLPGLFQEHFANDLGFLCNRPYLMAYQTTAQTGFANNSWNTVVMDTVGGVVHSDTGDNYSGWTSGASNKYTAQVPGWYLVVAEVIATYPGTTTSPSIRAGIKTATSGGRTPSATPDRYQEMFPSLATYPPGATAIGCYYLAAGESVTPQVYGQSYTSTTWGTATGTGIFCHMEALWLSE